MSDIVQPEFSRPFNVDRLGGEAVAAKFAATPEERAALARRLGLVALDRLDIEIRLSRVPGGDPIRVRGRFSADLVQTCIVSLEPFASHVEDEIAADFTERPDVEAFEIELDVDEEPAEPVTGGTIDLGELAAQFLSLALDPYPRAPGAALDEGWTGDGSAALNPFAALAGLRKPD